MAALQFSESDFLKAAKREKDFTNTKNKSFEEGAEDFLSSIYSDALQNDFLEYSLENLLTLAREFWMFGNRRKAGEVLLSVSPSIVHSDLRRPDTAIMVITDDMAFLVDSLVAAVSSFGVDVSGLFHPVVSGQRDKNGKWVPSKSAEESVRESMILLMIPPQNKRMRDAIEKELKHTLDEVKIINDDFRPLVKSVKITAVELADSHGDVPEVDVNEAVEFLEWIADGNFVFFGSRRYNYLKSSEKNGPSPDYVNPSVIDEHTHGLLNDPNLSVLRQSSEPSVITSNVKSFLRKGPPISVAKSNLSSRVHRRVRMDYISVKTYDDSGDVIGETRFVGLFTSDAYSRSPSFVPLLRHKVGRVMEDANLGEGTHNAKRLDFVLSTYPRDELFQISHEDLLRISTGVAQAFDRPRTRLFARRDPFNRFVSALVYVPLEHYNTRVRVRIGNRLKDAFGGRVSAFYPQYSDAPMARVHYIIGMDPDKGLHPDLDDLEAEIAAISHPWFRGLTLAADESEDADLMGSIGQYKNAFSIAYQDRFTTQDALDDVKTSETLSEDNKIAVRVYDVSGLKDQFFRGKIYSYGSRLEPSRVVPLFSNFACDVAQDTGYCLKRTDGQAIWVHDFEFKLGFVPDDADTFSKVFENAFIATWTGKNEDDGFNRLILPQGAAWRDIAFLRLVSRYRRQSGLDPSEATQIEALDLYPELTQKLLSLKSTKFDPEAFTNMKDREKAVKAIGKDIDNGLNEVRSLDHDRVIRRMASVVSSALRTNFYQLDDGEIKPYISLKIDSQAVDDLPAPRPYREVYVSSPRVEGVHLRFGPVARGGLRWSDRRDDFRTEVLGLVKAQQVKNAVIVPVGSKGGFYPKQLPKSGTRDEWLAEGIAAYKTFISGILDVTDNYEGEGTVPPADVVCWDKPDPYLVVAADKGTATFSDIANGISQDYGFWLDDAFASGGSVGYDHKAMGITARGGWEAVKRHFREMGKDIQSEDFTVIGVGDMSGDVFGNGMLLSPHIRLLAAFNHLDIFIDPNPDPSKSFKERQRMFELPRSTWQDYNKKLISKGGGVFSRSEKSIKLTPEIKALTGLSDDEVTPNRLLHALLKSEAELLWFGGIGTYVKAESESHGDVGDKANDSIRVNGRELKASVIGEGANLGLTQAGRIEFARAGGRLNTDAIDNSAGVDSSDNEVNIKILTGGAIERGSLKAKARNALLAKMTDEVADLVLQHNYDQTGALSLAESRTLNDHNAYERFMVSLEKRGALDRQVEGLPSTEIMQALASENKGLTRPEISVLMAYSKNTLFDDIIETDVADDPFLDGVLTAYFPKPLHKYKKAMAGHRLRREIITSRLINKIVDVGGPLFMMRLKEQTQGSLEEIAKAFIVAYETLHVADLKNQIAALDNKVIAEAQTRLHGEIARVMQRVVAWQVRRGETGNIAERIKKRAKLNDVVDSDWLNFLSPYDRKRAETRTKAFVKAGVPNALATDVALLRSRASGFDVVALANKTGWSVPRAASLFYDIGGRFKIDRIRSALLKSKSTSHWERLAMRHLQEDFFKAQARFAEDAANFDTSKAGKTKRDIDDLIDEWSKVRFPQLKVYETTVSTMSRKGGWTVAKFAIVNAQLSDLLASL